MKKINGKIYLIVLAILVVGVFVGSYFALFPSRQDTSRTSATSESKTITSEAEWEQGTLVSIDSTTTAGSIRMSDATKGRYLVADDSPVFDSSAQYMADDDTSTSTDILIPAIYYLAVDFLGPENVTSVKWFTTRLAGDETARIDYYNGSSWVAIADVSAWGVYQTESVSITATKIRAVLTGGTERMAVNELQAFNGTDKLYNFSSATHTTGATQIDGGENFWSWEGFTPTDSKPANTSITYRYRTSTDGATWTSWVGDIGSVTSRTGDDSNDPTLYRYLQVEATLANTDGASTPTIDAYDIDYHTEVKPTKPVAQTAVAQ
ncbi:MAG: hypothetical protein ABH810_01095 [bacterium]